MSLGVVIADDQALVRAGFRMILETDPQLEVLAEVSTGDAGARQSHGGCRPGHRADGHPDAGDGRARGDAGASPGWARRRGC